MLGRIEKSKTSNKNHQYVGYAAKSGIYYIHRPAKKGGCWYMFAKGHVNASHFANTLKELNDKLENL